MIHPKSKSLISQSLNLQEVFESGRLYFQGNLMPATNIFQQMWHIVKKQSTHQAISRQLKSLRKQLAHLIFFIKSFLFADQAHFTFITKPLPPSLYYKSIKIKMLYKCLITEQAVSNGTILIIQFIRLITSYNISASQRREENQFENMDRISSENSTVAIQNGEQKCLSVNSQIIMELGQDQMQSQRLYQSAHVDQMLQTSYVQLQNQQIATRQESTNFNSGESFFQKSNLMVHSQMGNKTFKRMINKKLQCDIGSRNSQKQTDIANSVATLEGKKRRLAILKVIKLLRLVFKQFRNSKQKIKLQIIQEQQKNKEILQYFALNISLMHAKYADCLGSKDMRIIQLEQEIKRISKMNDWLNSRLQLNERASKQLINEMEEDKIKSLAEINEKSMSASLKVEEFQQENETLEEQISFLQTQLANLQETIGNQEVYIKKLEYQNGQFEKENQILFKRQEQIIKQYQQHQQNYNQINFQLCQSNEEIRKMSKVNDLYQRQLQSTKEQVRRLEEINAQIVKQSESIIMSELNRYQEQFNEELEKIKRQHNQQIFNKNTIIDNLKEFQEKYMFYLSKDRNKTNKNGILKKIDTNSSQNSINYQSEENIVIPNSVSSESFINQSQCSQNTSSKMYPNIEVDKKQVKRGLERKTTFKKIVQTLQKQKPARSQKMKMKSLNQCPQPPKQPLIAAKNGTSKEYIFKAKDKASNLNLKLTQYLQLKQGNALSENDKLSIKAQSRIIKLNQNVNKQGLLSQRK